MTRVATPAPWMVALGAAIAVVGGVPAEASTVGHAVNVPAAGPVLTGAGGAAWVEPDSGRGLTVRTGDAAGAVRTVARYEGEPETLPNAAIAASPSWLAIERGRAVDDFEGGAPNRSIEVLAGPSGGPLTPFSPRCPEAQSDRIRSIDADAGQLVFQGPGCGEGSLRGADGETRSPFPPGAFGLRVAGRYVAWVEGPSPPYAPRALVVHDTTDGREALRVLEDTLPGPIRDLDLDGDGTVAMLSLVFKNQRYDGRIAVASPSAAKPRVIRSAIEPAAPGKLSAGRILAVDRVQRRPRRLVVLDAGTGRLMDAGPPMYAYGGADLDYDFDGTRVASVVRECHRVVLDVSYGPPSASGRRKPCRLRLEGRPRLVGRRLRLRVSCDGFQIGCVSRVTVRQGRRTLASGTAFAPREVALPLGRAERRRLARRPRVRVIAAFGQLLEIPRPAFGSVKQSIEVRVRR